MPRDISVKSSGDCSEVQPPFKSKSMLSSNTLVPSTGNAPKLSQLDDNATCSTFANTSNDVSLTDSINSVKAFPVIISAMEETIQMTDADQTPTEQSSSRLDIYQLQ